VFGNNKKTVNSVGEIETIIGKDTAIKGTISSKGTIRIDGQFEGDISTTGNIMVGDNAIIKAQVTALNATIAGAVYGNVDIAEKLELLPSGKMYGDIKVGVLIISAGATFKGACEMRQGMELPAIEENLVCANP
jgi:cytoskeletal protein CcmA (bactofilin family)